MQHGTSHLVVIILPMQVMLVRGELTALERATIGALVVLDVHGRDVVQEMVKDHVAMVSDFSWQVGMPG